MHLNGENTCAHLVEGKNIAPPTLREMFEMQLSLQRNMFARGKGIDYENASFKDRVDQLTIQKRNLDTEFVELLERLPWKEWKTYPQESLAGFLSKEQELETKFEFVDMFHFFMNIGLLIGITPEELSTMYYLKNEENFERQKRGY